MDWRKMEESLARGAMGASLAAVFAALALVLGVIVAKGAPNMSLALLTRAPEGGFYMGGGGGVLNAIVGSLAMAGLATAAALALALPVVLWLNIYRSPASLSARAARFAFDLLWGVPSIVHGAFGFTLMLALGLKASLLCGAATLTLLALPIACRALDEVVSMAPKELPFVAYALGATRFEAAFKVLLRQIAPGIATAALLSFGRAAGDAASVLFTAGFTDALPRSPLDPAASLPLAIFFQLGTPMPEVQGRAYGAALALTLLVLAASLGARAVLSRLSSHVVR